MSVDTLPVNKERHDMNVNEPKPSVPDEVASAEAELLAAQEALDAARTRLAELKEEHPPLSAETPERVCDGTEHVEVTAVVVDGATSEVEAVIFETTPPCSPDAGEDAEKKAGEDEGQYPESGAPGDDGSASATIPIESSSEAPASDEEPVEFAGAAAQPEPPAFEETPVQPVPTWVPYSTAASAVQGYGAQSSGAPGAVPPPPNAGYYGQQPQPQQPQPQQPQPQPQQPQPQQPYGGYVAPGYQQNPAPHAGPGAVPPQQPYPGYPYPNQYQQPYYQQPAVGTKDHIAAGLLAIFLGPLGIHKFYLGYNTAGFIMLAVAIIGGIVTFTVAWWAMWIIAIIEGILYLTKSQSEFEQMYVVTKREWF